MRRPDPYQVGGLLLILGAVALWLVGQRGDEADRSADPDPIESIPVQGFDPLNPRAYRLVAERLEELGRPQQAARVRAAARRLESGDPAESPDPEHWPTPKPEFDLPAEELASASDAYHAVRMAEEADLDGALRKIRQAIEADGEDAPNLTALGIIHMHRAEPLPAEEALTKAIRIDASYAPAWLGRGILHRKAHRFRQAAEDLGKACEIVPSMVQWRLHLAEALRGAGEVDAALRALEEALVLTPASPRIYRMVGDCLLRGGREEEARRWYAATLRIGGPREETEDLRGFLEGR